MKALIIDNEQNIIDGLKALIKIYCPDIKQLLSAQNLDQAIEILEDYEVDIVFLDVELDNELGMDLFDKVQEAKFQLIFITAHNQYAIDAFKYNAIDYLLKPIDPDDLVSAVSKAVQSIDLKTDQTKLQKLMIKLNHLRAKEKRLVVNDRENIYTIEIQSILYLEADGPYTRIVKEKEEELFVSKNLKYFQNILVHAGFFRTHHSFLANLNHMVKFDKYNSQLVLKSGIKIPVSVRKKEGLLSRIREDTKNELLS